MYHGYISEYARINDKEWNSYVKIPIYCLYISVLEILKLKENLDKSLNGNIRDLIENDTNIKKILLGGIDDKGEYKKYSLANVYKDGLGISIDPIYYFKSHEWKINNRKKIPELEATNRRIDVKMDDKNYEIETLKCVGDVRSQLTKKRGNIILEKKFILY